MVASQQPMVDVAAAVAARRVRRDPPTCLCGWKRLKRSSRLDVDMGSESRISRQVIHAKGDPGGFETPDSMRKCWDVTRNDFKVKLGQFVPVVPHKVVAEVSKIGNYRRGELL